MARINQRRTRDDCQFGEPPEDSDIDIRMKCAVDEDDVYRRMCHGLLTYLTVRTGRELMLIHERDAERFVGNFLQISVEEFLPVSYEGTLVADGRYVDYDEDETMPPEVDVSIHTEENEQTIGHGVVSYTDLGRIPARE